MNVTLTDEMITAPKHKNFILLSKAAPGILSSHPQLTLDKGSYGCIQAFLPNDVLAIKWERAIFLTKEDADKYKENPNSVGVWTVFGGTAHEVEDLPKEWEKGLQFISNN